MVSGWSVYGDRAVLWAVHTNQAPTSSEWLEYLGQVREVIGKYPGLIGAVGLAVTDGGAPNFEQRAALVNVTGKIRPVTAVVSNSRVVRIATTALGALGYDIGVFAPEKFGEACEHLRISVDSRQKLVEDVQQAGAGLPRCATVMALRL